MEGIESRRPAGALSPFRVSPFLSQDPAFRRIERMFDEAVAELFGGAALPAGQREVGFFQPQCDIDETRDGYLVTMDVPGLRKEDIAVEIEGNVLVISGERRREVKEGQGSERHVERRYGRFERRFSLPQDIAADTVLATYKDGELRLVLPKSMQEKRRRIELRDADTGKDGRLAEDGGMIMQGIHGAQGMQGSQGMQGTKGTVGTVGTVGDRSARNDHDLIGKTGMQGVRGDQTVMDGQAPN